VRVNEGLGKSTNQVWKIELEKMLKAGRGREGNRKGGRGIAEVIE